MTKMKLSDTELKLKKLAALAKAGSTEVFGTATQTNVSGSVTVDGTVPVHFLTLAGDIQNGVTVSPLPAAGHTCHVIFKAAADRIIKMNNTNNATMVFPDGGDELSLDIPAGGFAEISFLSDGTNLYVRGI